MTATDVAVATSTLPEPDALPPLRAPSLPSRPRSNVRPVRLYAKDEGTTLTVSRIVAYRFECSCKARGECWPTWREAAAERRYHAGTHEP